MMMSELSKIEELAARNAKPVNLTPMEEWDAAVADWMAKDNCSRDCAVDRIWGQTSWGSSLWNKACMWWSAQPQMAVENNREVRNGMGSFRRIPRRP
jgi:hypothetical protein